LIEAWPAPPVEPCVTIALALAAVKGVELIKEYSCSVLDQNSAAGRTATGEPSRGTAADAPAGPSKLQLRAARAAAALRSVLEETCAAAAVGEEERLRVAAQESARAGMKDKTAPARRGLPARTPGAILLVEECAL
jgi:hypothetical protein